MDDFKFNILGMSMKKGDICRLVVEGNKAMYEAWLKRVNEDWPAPLTLDEALECSEYVSGYSKEKDAYYIWFEIEVCKLTCSNEIHVIYLFDDYEFYYDQYIKNGWNVFVFFTDDLINNLDKRINEVLSNVDNTLDDSTQLSFIEDEQNEC